MVAKTQIERLREPSLKLVDYVTLEMTNIAREVVMKVTRTNLSLSWACLATRMVPRLLVVAVLSLCFTLTIYFACSFACKCFHAIQTMIKYDEQRQSLVQRNKE